MLKNITPDELLQSETNKSFVRLNLFAAFGVYGGAFLLGSDVWNFWPNGVVLMFLFFVSMLVYVLWYFVALWLGRFPIGAGTHALAYAHRYPRFVQSFLDSWWNNELVLDVFVVVFRVAFCLGIYQACRPLLWRL